jgi:acetyl-CoA carboxylase carboxyltransferase component
MSTEALLTEYETRRAKALAGGGEEKYAKRKAAGSWNARERIAALVDPDSFMNPVSSAPQVFIRSRPRRRRPMARSLGTAKSTVVM